MHAARPEYQDRVNFVVLDYNADPDYELAERLGVARHPAFAVLPPDSDKPAKRIAGPLPPDDLRVLLDETARKYAP